MRRGLGIVLLVGALGASFAVGHAVAQDEGAADMEAMKAAWEELGKPGPEHAEMKSLVGDWTSTMKEFQPDGSTKESSGTVTYSMVMNDLILRQDFTGQAGGVEFQGVGYMAFNKATGKYESVWMDSMSSGMAWMDGQALEKANAWEYKGHWFAPGGMKVHARLVLERLGEDRQSMEYFMDMGQGEMKSMEILYERNE